MEKTWKEAVEAATCLDIPARNVLLKVNGHPVSTPSKDSAEALRRPVTESVEHVMSGSRSQYNYSYLNISHEAFNMGTHSSRLRDTLIAMRDIVNFKVTTLDSEDQVLSLVQFFNPDAERAPETAHVISFGATSVDHHGDPSEESFGEGVETVKSQLSTLKGELETASKDNPVQFEMLVLPDQSESQMRSLLATLEKTVKYLSHEELVNNPADAWFFNKNQQTMAQRSVPLSLVPNTKHTNFPAMPVQAKRTRYITRDERTVYLLCGIACELAAKDKAVTRLKSESFKASVLPFKYYGDTETCILTVFPEGRASMLPQNGEECLVSIQGRPRTEEAEHTNVPEAGSMSDRDMDNIARAIVKISFDSFGEDEAELIRADASRFFVEPLAIEEVGPLHVESNETPSELYARALQFCMDRRARLAVQTHQPSTRHNEDDGDGEDELAQGQAEADPESDPDQWCHAQRMDSAAVHKPGCQTYIVRAAKNMRKKNLEFPWVAVEEGETQGQYMDRVFDEKNLADVRFGKQVSHEVEKLQFHAINSLAHPASAPSDAPISDRSRAC